MSFTKFKSLHESNELFILPNAWNARSAVALEQAGFHAIGTSSAAVANSLGLEDGENMDFADYLFVIKRIAAAIRVPLTVDIETGYAADADQIAENIMELTKVGVCGINIEDSIINEGSRELRDPGLFAALISELKSKLKQKDKEVFINLRTDAYILNVDNKETETLTRISLYNKSGADGLFVPCIAKEEDIAGVIRRSTLPVNVMAIGGLPNFKRLSELGVRRLSMGPFMFQKVYGQIGHLSKRIIEQGSVLSLLQD